MFEKETSEIIADDLLRESLHRIYWGTMVKVVGEEKANEIVKNLGKKGKWGAENVQQTTKDKRIL
jgi:hypothetical protein